MPCGPLDRYLPRTKVPGTRIRTLPRPTRSDGQRRSRPLFRLQALRSHLPVAGEHPGVHPSRTEQGGPGERPHAARLAAGTHAAAQPVRQPDRAAGEFWERQSTVPPVDGTLRRHPPAAAATEVSMADLRELVQAPYPTDDRHSTEGRLLLWLLG